MLLDSCFGKAFSPVCQTTQNTYTLYLVFFSFYFILLIQCTKCKSRVIIYSNGSLQGFSLKEVVWPKMLLLIFNLQCHPCMQYIAAEGKYLSIKNFNFGLLLHKPVVHRSVLIWKKYSVQVCNDRV